MDPNDPPLEAEHVTDEPQPEQDGDDESDGHVDGHPRREGEARVGAVDFFDDAFERQLRRAADHPGNSRFFISARFGC